jgi:hypothetical protein
VFARLPYPAGGPAPVPQGAGAVVLTAGVHAEVPDER